MDDLIRLFEQLQARENLPEDNGEIQINYISDIGLRKPEGEQSFTICDDQIRRIEVMPNISGHRSYMLDPGDGYLVTIYTGEGRQQLGTKPMRLVRKSDDCLEFRGYPVIAFGPFGPIDFNDNEDFGLKVFLNNGTISHCIFLRYDTRIEYLYGSVQDALKRKVNACTSLLDSSIVPARKTALMDLSSFMGGPARIKAILDYSDMEGLAECMIQMLIDDIPSTHEARVNCASIALFCLYRQKSLGGSFPEDRIAVFLDLYNLAISGHDELEETLSAITDDPHNAYEKLFFWIAGELSPATQTYNILPEGTSEIDSVLHEYCDVGWNHEEIESDIFKPAAICVRNSLTQSLLNVNNSFLKIDF